MRTGNSHPAVVERNSPRILLLYTGGTIGMKESSKGLMPVQFDELLSFLPPQYRKLNGILEWRSILEPIDSADIQPNHWQEISKIIAEEYDFFDGFVVLHGTDTMAYTASALSFMLQNVQKPIILTGSQLPIGHLRSEAILHLNTAIEFAMSQDLNNMARLRGVCLLFHNKVFRGNRAIKNTANGFDAFHSPNFPIIACAGTDLVFNDYAINHGYSSHNLSSTLQYYPKLIAKVDTIKFYPGMNPEHMNTIMNCRTTRVVILEGFGSGNIPSSKFILKSISDFINRGGIVLALSQCWSGGVDLKIYQTGRQLLELGAISGKDLTFEAALTKSMHLLAYEKKYDGITKSNFTDLFTKNLAGEMDEPLNS